MHGTPFRADRAARQRTGVAVVALWQAGTAGVRQSFFPRPERPSYQGQLTVAPGFQRCATLADSVLPPASSIGTCAGDAQPEPPFC